MKRELLYMLTDIRPISVEVLLDFGWRRFQHAVFAGLLLPYKRVSTTPHRILPYLEQAIYVIDDRARVWAIHPGPDPRRFFSCGLLTQRAGLDALTISALIETDQRRLIQRGHRAGLKLISHVRQEELTRYAAAALGTEPLKIADYIVRKSSIFNQHPILAFGATRKKGSAKKPVQIQIIKDGKQAAETSPAADWILEPAFAYI